MIAPPETKRAAWEGTTLYTTKHTTDSTATPGGAQYAVVCTKASTGARVQFQRYATRDEAEAVARQLRAVGCACDVEVAG